MLGQAINIEGLSLDKFIEHHVANSGWVLEKSHGRSQLIVLPRNEFNHPELQKHTAEGVPFEHVTRIFPMLSWICSWDHIVALLFKYWNPVIGGFAYISYDSLVALIKLVTEPICFIFFYG